MALNTRRFRWVLDVTAFVGAVVAIAIGLYNIHADRRNDENARSNDARAARHDIIADVLQMGQYDAAGGLSNEHEILVLAADAEQLIEDFGQDRLHLSPTLYRLLAEYVSYSTRDLERAARLAHEVLEVAEPGSREIVFAHRVLGDVAAQSLDPAEVEREYGVAMGLNEEYVADGAYVRKNVEDFTLAFRLLSAYLGVSLSQDEDEASVRAEFCDRAEKWHDDLGAIERLKGNDRVAGQLRRINAKGVADLEAMCP